MNQRTNASLTKLAEAAFVAAAKQVIQRADESGTPVIVWEDGRVKAMAPRKRRTRPRKKKSRERSEE